MCIFLAYDSWCQHSPADCEIENDLRGIEPELLLLHFGMFSEQEVFHWVAESVEYRNEESNKKANPGSEDKKKWFTTDRLQARIDMLADGENHSWTDLIGVDDAVLEHLKAALRLAPPVKVVERAACGVMRQNRVHDERAWIINCNVIQRLDGTSSGAPPQAWMPHEDVVSATADGERRPHWRVQRKFRLEEEHARYGLKVWYYDPGARDFS